MSRQERPYQTVNRPNGSLPQRFCHAEHGGSRPANGQPDGICLDRMPLRKLRTVIPTTNSSSLPIGGTLIIEQTTIEDPTRGFIRATRIVPTAVRPPIPPMEIPIGGTRTIGGGTSREATRRAKKKSKSRRRN